MEVAIKKLLIVLVSLTLAFSLAGCDKKNAKAEKTNDAKISSVAVEKEASEEEKAA